MKSSGRSFSYNFHQQENVPGVDMRKPQPSSELAWLHSGAIPHGRSTIEQTRFSSIENHD